MNLGALYLDYEYAIAAAQLTLAMLGMGCTLRPADFLALLRLPRAFITGLLLQLLAVPALAGLLISLLNLPTGVAVGLAIIAVTPGGATSNVFTWLARGHVALSIALTATMTLACTLTAPLLLRWLIADQVPPDFALPTGQIAGQIGLFLLLPLAVGMALRQGLPALARRLAGPAIRASFGLILVIAIGAALAGRLDWAALGPLNVLVILGFALLLLGTGMAVPTLLRLPRADRLAIAMEVTVRNINLGVLVVALLFPAGSAGGQIGDLALFVNLLYGGLMLGLATALALPARRQRR